MRLLLILNLLLISSFAWGHARLKANGVIPPRNNSDGLKTGPCGNVAKGNNPTVLQAGTVITLTWEETIQHPGYYDFKISYDNDQTFTYLKLPNGQDAKIIDTQDNRNDLPHQYSAQVVVPDMNCTNCSIQMVQMMTENPNNPRPYFSCADITIVGAGNPLLPASPNDGIINLKDVQLEGSPLTID
jgi:hypothetical protein